MRRERPTNSRPRKPAKPAARAARPAAKAIAPSRPAVRTATRAAAAENLIRIRAGAPGPCGMRCPCRPTPPRRGRVQTLRHDSLKLCNSFKGIDMNCLQRFSALALVFALAPVAWAAGNKGSSEARQRYQQERAYCMSGQSQQDRATCLKEAGAAYDEARRGRLDNSGGDS